VGSPFPWRWARRVIAAVALGALGVAGAILVFRPMQVVVTPAVRRDMALAIQGVGTVEAKVVVRIAAKITGRVVSVSVDQGDRVRAGQVLATLEHAEQQALIQQAAATVQRGHLGAAGQEVAIRKARANIQSAEAAVARLQATESLARANAGRWQQLHQEGGVSRMDMDVRVTEATAAGEELRTSDAVRRATQEELAVAQAVLETLRQDVRVAEAALAAARARHTDTEIRSPLDGLVVSRELEAGATVNPGTAILKLVDPRTAWTTVHVDEAEVGGISVGDPADLSLRSLPGQTLRGRVARIQRESDRVTEQLAIDIAFEELPVRLALGEQAEARIRPPGRKDVIAMPLSALVRLADGAGAWTVVRGRLAFRVLRLGVVDPDGWIEVLEGLRPGAEVVVGPGRLADHANEGRRVTAVRPRSPAHRGGGPVDTPAAPRSDR